MRGVRSLSLMMASALALAAISACAPVAGPVVRHADHPPAELPQRAQSLYVKGSGGDRLAVDLYLLRHAANERVPTLVVSSRYGRRGEVKAHFANEWTQRGYALVVFDSVGSGVSTGVREAELSDTEIADVGAISRWAASQSWSNGAVVLMGLSYSADTADLGATLGEPAIRAAIVRSAESDPYRHLFFPGGVANAMMRDLWGSAVAGRDRSVTCIADASACAGMTHIGPVDGDDDFTKARTALRDHLANARLDIDLLGVTYADDPLPGRNFSIAGMGTVARADAVRAAGVPAQVWGSWLDAGTAQSALERFALSKGVPVEVRITAASHGAYAGADPFKPQPQQPMPSVTRQFELLADFADRALSGSATRSIRYAILGSDAWRQTPVWPPAGVEPRRFYLGESDLRREPGASESTVSYKVDFNATTGAANRWTANTGVIPDYAGWSHKDASLARFTSAPFMQDFELAGAPRIALTLSSTHEDGAVFAYLAVQRSDGRLVYLTEGMLRVLHRRVREKGGALERSFRRADVQPMVPGEMANIVFDAFPVAARIAAGDRLVLLLAGADRDTFARYPTSGDPVWSLDVGGADASFIDIPLRPWSSGAAGETQGL